MEKEKEIGSEEQEQDKPVLDEQTLGKLLEAAYVLQEHNRELQELELGLSLKREQIEAEERASPSPPRPTPRPPNAESGANFDYTTTLAKIVETQHQIQVRHLGLENAMSLVAERLTQIARASGSAIGILDDKKFRYRAANGLLTLPVGTEVPMDKALCVACLRTGQVFRCEDVNPEFLLDTDECRRRGIQSMIGVPIFHDGSVAGGLELYYPTTHAFTEQDVHTCQLMAGLVTEALARDEETTWKKSLVTERAVMLDGVEKLKPSAASPIHQSITEKSLPENSIAREETPRIGSPAASVSGISASESRFVCRKCGHGLVGEEQFCGNCGTPRSSSYEEPSMQSKVASVWNMQESMKKAPPADLGHSIPMFPTREENAPREKESGAHSEKSLADSLEEQVPELFEATDIPISKAGKPTDSEAAPTSAVFEDSILSDLEIPSDSTSQNSNDAAASASTVLAKAERPTAWSSAASARDFLEQLAGPNRPGALARFWSSRRGDVYLGIAVLLVACVIRWGILSNHSVGANGSQSAETAAHRKSGADLSLFDRMLISIGLAEAPPAPIDNGNPDTQVWVDLHTALYYCPGSDLYGKTPKGKFTSQRDAQLDQFEPAYRKTCD